MVKNVKYSLKTALTNLILAAAVISFTASAGAAGESGNVSSAGSLLSAIESYLASAGVKGPYEDNIKARLAALDAIWSLGEIGDPGLMTSLSGFYAGSDDVIKINLIISMGKLKNSARSGPYLAAIASSPDESEVVRAAAFEMLDETGQPAPPAPLVPSKNTGIEKADILYTSGKIGTIASWGSSDLPIGHAGIFAGTEIKNGRINILISDCVVNYLVPGGVRNIRSWKDFLLHFTYPYYGNRTTRVRPTAAQREKIVQLGLKMGKMGLKYDVTHLSQKGPLIFDCVGYTEYLYEQAGLNPTPDSFEYGWGWPLTPYEQFSATTPAPAARIPYARQTPPPAAPAAGVFRSLKALPEAFGINARIIDISTDILPEAAD